MTVYILATALTCLLVWFGERRGRKWPWRICAALPLIDPHGLFVAPAGAQDGRAKGLRYDDARHGDGHRRRKFGISQLLFGWQGKVSGKFHRFNIIYHAETDSVTVHTCCTHCLNERTGSCGNSKCRYCHGEDQ